MPITVYYTPGPGQALPCVLRPAPLISINPTPNKTGVGDTIGMSYDITLTGTILSYAGSPFGINNSSGGLFDFENGVDAGSHGPYDQFYNGSNFFDGVTDHRPPRQVVPMPHRLDSIISKIKAINALFAIDGQKVEISSVHGDGPDGILWCNPSVTGISYTEGIYTDRCDYVIRLQANSLYSSNGEITIDGRLSIDKDKQSIIVDSGSIDSSIKKYYISNYDESWSLGTDEDKAETYNGIYISPKTYSVTHNVSAVGKTHYMPDGTKLRAWDEARKFVHEVLMVDNDSLIDNYPGLDVEIADGKIKNFERNQLFQILGAGILNINVDQVGNEYCGYNRIVQESIDETSGSYSLTETYLLSKDTAYENYSISVSKTLEDPHYSVSIEGSIKGLSKMQSMEYVVDKEHEDSRLPIYYANEKWKSITNNNTYGLNSEVFKRCNAVQSSGSSGSRDRCLNPDILSQSYTVNDTSGEINYSLSYNNRPLKTFSGTTGENITVQDTYPGDVFSVVPVIGRRNGPVLQYMGSKSEYKRNVSIDLKIKHETDEPCGYEPSIEAINLSRKPSIVEPTKTELQLLLMALSPANEVNIKKYFLSAPTETWEPTSGSYSLQIEWTYELGDS